MAPFLLETARSEALFQSYFGSVRCRTQVGRSLGSEVGTDVVLSPEGSRLVFVSRDASDVEHLNTRALDQSQTTELKGTNEARNPFFSPDGEWVAFGPREN